MIPDQTGGSPDSHPEGILEQEESQLWRWVLGFFILLAFALAALLWERLENIPFSLRAIPIGVLALSILFAVYAYGRRREVSELKGLLRGLQEHVGAAPSEEQLDQLSQVILRSQRNFKELIDSLDDPACATALDGTLRTVNRRVAELTGLPYTELVGHKIFDFFEEPARELLEGGLGRFLEKRRWAGVVRVQLKNNPRPLYFDCMLNAIVKGDEVVGASILGRDVTEQREKEMRFTELFETLQEGVYFSTPDGHLLDANPALVNMLGYTEKKDLLLVDPSALNFEPGPPALGRAVDDHGGLRTREIKLRRKDGAAAVFLDSSRAVWDTSGNIIRYQGTLVDITEKRKMERELAQQEEFRRRLLESFPDLILVVDLGERYTFVNSRARDLLGYQPEDLVGKKISDLEDHSPEMAALYHTVVSGKQAFASAEYGARHRDGNWRTMRASCSQLFDAEGKTSGVIMSVRDITLERKLEQQVVQSERLAAMGAMIGGVAHELNNPLTSILGVSELMQDKETSESGRKQLALLQQQARRAADIVQNLTYFARPPAPGKSRLNLIEVIDRTLNLHAYSLRKNNITVDFLREEGLPYALGDPHQLMQVFLNLIMNAEQAIREARDKGTLRIRTGKSDGSVWVSFHDDGPGIPKENLPSIFDPFYTTKRPGRGTGLGLSICKSVIKEHNGSIDATNAADGGAVFTVTLPVAG
ncbi:putative Histidine kinase [Candidatus Sulfotelmatobacter kueseliae]|uniref:histidine kinase n=1 Tax=Candidatus Sulfotelmatobacter kueseliae TaxID=2042962 RepID=A0A2U3KNR2_9BACT|nr:putative Histidine kinase [Candidatus Sulfotelmatobacter kueseliae]